MVDGIEEEDGLVTVLLLPGVAGLVVTLEGVTTVRVTVLDGWVVVVVAGRVVVVVVVAGRETFVLPAGVGLTSLAAGSSVLGAVTVVVVGLLVELPPVVVVVLELAGCT